MNVLFLYKDKKCLTYNYLYDSLSKDMLSCGYSVSDDIRKYSYNLIVALGPETINEAFKIKSELTIPVIFIFCKSDLRASYQIALNKVDYIIMYEDKVSKTSFPINKRTCRLSMPFIIPDNSSEFMHKKLTMPKIYVHIDEKYFNGLTTIKLIRILNQLTRYEIMLCNNTVSKNLRRVLNSNIQLSIKTNFKENVHQSDIVIGSGYVLLYALLSNKFGIIVGERGYGGIVNNDNVESHYRNFFQGRNGGKYDEPIPERLLLEDINSISSGVRLHADLFSVFSKFADENKNTFSDIVEKVSNKCSYLSKNKLNTPLIFNSDFTIQQSGERYWILDRYIRHIYGWIDQKQYDVVDKFISENTISTVFQDIPQSEHKKLLKFVDEMIEKKIFTVFI